MIDSERAVSAEEGAELVVQIKATHFVRSVLQVLFMNLLSPKPYLLCQQGPSDQTGFSSGHV